MSDDEDEDDDDDDDDGDDTCLYIFITHDIQGRYETYGMRPTSIPSMQQRFGVRTTVQASM